MVVDNIYDHHCVNVQTIDGYLLSLSVSILSKDNVDSHLIRWLITETIEYYHSIYVLYL
jgi:hypothetical protein